jgi:DNA helicase HerA-like ATPase
MPRLAADHLSLFARTNFRGRRRLFGIKRADRRSHMYVIGKTGTGKSTLLETLLRQDIGNGGAARSWTRTAVSGAAPCLDTGAVPG